MKLTTHVEASYSSYGVFFADPDKCHKAGFIPSGEDSFIILHKDSFEKMQKSLWGSVAKETHDIIKDLPTPEQLCKD